MNPPSFFKPEDFNGALTASKKNSLDNCAAYANRLLMERGVRVYGRAPGERCKWAGFCDYKAEEHDTHTGLLIAIESLKAPDTAESLLRELCQWASESHVIEYTGPKPPSTLSMHSIIGRARKLLERGG